MPVMCSVVFTEDTLESGLFKINYSDELFENVLLFTAIFRLQAQSRHRVAQQHELGNKRKCKDYSQGYLVNNCALYCSLPLTFLHLFSVKRVICGRKR